jgi:hypothetical protein
MLVEADAGNTFLLLCEDAHDDAGSTAVDQGLLVASIVGLVMGRKSF